jgi:hypothetical protein
MSQRFLIIVLVVGFAMGFAAATLLFRQGTDESESQSRGPSISTEKRTHYPESQYASQSHPYGSSANSDNEDSSTPVSGQKSEERVQTASQAESIGLIPGQWGDLVDKLGLDYNKANELMKIYINITGPDREARLREALGDAGYQAYLDYLPTLPARGVVASFKNELASRDIPLPRETEQKLLEIVCEELPVKPSEWDNENRSEHQARERIYQRASGVLSGEALALLKPGHKSRLEEGLP